MAVTALGFLFIPLGLVIFLAFPKRLLALAVFSAVLQASSILNLGELGVPPYYFVAVLIFIRLLWLILRRGLRVRVPMTVRPLLWFWIWACLTAAFCPLIFREVQIFDPRGGLEAILAPLVRLHWSLGNIVQPAYLGINIAVLIYAAQGEAEGVRSAFNYAVVFASLLIITQLAFVAVGWPFPYKLLNNNPAYVQQHLDLSRDLNRPSGAFVEPSVAGAFFCAIASGFLAAFLSGTGRMIAAVVAIALLGVIASGAGLLGFAIVIVLLAVRFFPLRSHYLVLPRLKRWALLGGLSVGAIAAILAIPSLLASVAANTINKQGTASMIVRTATDVFGLNLALQTYGLGAGLGSVRTSSFAVFLLANTGVIGLLLFVWFIHRVLKESNDVFLTWCLIGLLSAEIVGVPDLSLTVLWMVLGVAISRAGLCRIPKLPIRESHGY